MGLFNGIGRGAKWLFLGGKKNPAPPTATATVPPPVDVPLTTATIVAADNAAAKVAAMKVRKRALGGSLLTRPKAPVSGSLASAGALQPRTLIGR